MVAIGIVACLLPPGKLCGEGWCAEGYRCASIDSTSTCIKLTCGDGSHGPDEECDDGNLSDNDGCLQTCSVNNCGDGQVNPSIERCDDGNLTDNDGCDSNCTMTTCGNNIVTPGEMCDDGNNNIERDGCMNGCTASLLAYLKASNTNKYDHFGAKVAISADGSTLAVGAPEEESLAVGIGGDQTNNSGYANGAVYVFKRNGMSWHQQAYIKATNTGILDRFGWSIALSADGSTLVVGAPGEDSATKGVNGNQADNSAYEAGAAYVFTRIGTTWSQQAYLKASDTAAFDHFGNTLAISADGSTLAVGAPLEDSAAIGVNGNQADISADSAGAVYVFTRTGTTWSQQAYVKASNTNTFDIFGTSVSLSADGSTLAVGAWMEDSAATGVNGNQYDNYSLDSGAAYVFSRSGTTWIQRAYIKASNTDSDDRFGSSVALSADGLTLAVGAQLEDSRATGTSDNGQHNNDFADSGAVYIFFHNGTMWSQQAYIKASNTNEFDEFGYSLAFSANGSILAVSTPWEDSQSSGIGGDQSNNGAKDAGAVYVFTRNSTTWGQLAYIKASDTIPGDEFGSSIALSADDSTLAVGALSEDSAAIGIGGDLLDDSAKDAGAVYVFKPRAWVP